MAKAATIRTIHRISSESITGGNQRWRRMSIVKNSSMCTCREKGSPASGPAKEPFELDIDEGNGKKGRMHFDDMRSIDKMRVIEKKGYRSVCTPRADIEAAFKKYMGL